MPKHGRAFNHPEDLILFYGSSGLDEVVTHFRDLSTDSGAKTIRLKWDGSPQVYWGRNPDKKLILGTHSAWTRNVQLQSADDIYKYIVDQGQHLSDLSQRKEFAHAFSNLYGLLDASTPKHFKGFVYADALYINRPQLVDGVFTMHPNPHSDTQYHVELASQLGKRINNSNVLLVGHACYSAWSECERAQQPIADFSKFNNHNTIVLDPWYNSGALEVNLDRVNYLQNYISNHRGSIDAFLASVAGLSDLKQILYRFTHQSAKVKKLNAISKDMFFEWLANSTVSSTKQQKIHQLEQQYNVLHHIFTLVKLTILIKDSIISQLDTAEKGIKIVNGEGYVRYADENKKHGHIKLVPRDRWIPK